MYRRRKLGDTGRMINVGARDHHVSVRLPESVYKIIDSYPGKNFNDRLVNYIIDHYKQIHP